MAVSSDATCRSLRSPKEGPLVIEMTEGKQTLLHTVSHH